LFFSFFGRGNPVGVVPFDPADGCGPVLLEWF